MTMTNAQFRVAQEAVALPEVQEIIRRLAAYNLGVSMPHMHDAEGRMLPLPENVVQVEDDLVVSFRPSDEAIASGDREYMPVGWRWSAEHNRAEPTTHCPFVKDQTGNWTHSGQRKTN